MATLIFFHFASKSWQRFHFLSSKFRPNRFDFRTLGSIRCIQDSCTTIFLNFTNFHQISFEIDRHFTSHRRAVAAPNKEQLCNYENYCTDNHDKFDLLHAVTN